MAFRSVNPKNGKLTKTYERILNNDMYDKLEKSYKSYKYMRNCGADGIKEMIEKCEKLKLLMQERKQKISEAITNDMGKPIKESIGEVEKSMSMIDYMN